jgi:8-oxo-dGTP pyrophosphatase MutT (NUDIX family)
MTNPAEPRAAATVMLLRDDPQGGVEVYLIQRHHKSGFLGGAYAFPGGKVDDADREHPDASRAAAVRETMEEVGVTIEAEDLVHSARWVTPEAEPRRFDADFYVVRLPEGAEAAPADRESLRGAWFRPGAAVEAMRSGELFMAPPTLRSLEILGEAADVDDALARADASESPVVRPVMRMQDGRLEILLPGDPDHDDPNPIMGGATRFTLVDRVWE